MVVCGACGQENPDGFRFCGACASPLTERPPSREERKVVTALFCDLVGSTAQAEKLDPEDVQAFLGHYHEHVAGHMERFGGTVEKFIGDAVVALFGVPVAHEDDPERAVRAALAIRDWVADQDDLHVRMAINTGEALVVMGARPDHGEHFASGDVLNTAARLQSAAPVDGILAGEQTYRNTNRVIEFRPHAPVQAKGKADPVHVWEVVSARSRFGSDVNQQPSRALVGRAWELGLLRDALTRCQSEDTAQLVTLVGVPGIGKSRLIAELFQVLDASPDVFFWRQGRSLPYGESQSFWALSEIVKAQAGILESDGAQDARMRMTEMLAAALDDDRERAWVEGHVQPLLGIGDGGDVMASGREESFAAWRRLFEGLAEDRPLILVFEDLHWADDGLLDFVDHLADWASSSPILLLATARPELLERRPGWGGGKRNALTVSISPLSNSDTATLLNDVLGQLLLPAEIHAAVIGLAGGNPLYAEEYVRMLQDRGLLRRDGDSWSLSAAEQLPLPETIHGLVAARIDALPGEEKALLHDAAVVGKVFWPSAASSITPREPAEAERILHGLERKEFVRRERRSAVAGETQYAFLHAIVREVAYRQIPRPERTAKHLALARWTEALAPDRIDDRADMLAHHYGTALDLTRAAGGDETTLRRLARDALAAASERADMLGAWSPAREQAARALSLTDPEDPLGSRLAVRAARAAYNLGDASPELAEVAYEWGMRHGDLESAGEAEALRSIMCWERGEVEAAQSASQHAVELVGSLPTSAAKVWVIANQARRACLMHNLPIALELVADALPAAEELERHDYISHLLNTRGMARVWSGDERGLEDLRAAIDRGERANAGFMIATAQNNLCLTLWLVGRLNEGGEFLAAHRRTAQQFGLQALIAWSDHVEGQLALLRGEYQEMIEISERNLASTEKRHLYVLSSQHSILSLGYATQGRIEEAIDRSEDAMVLARQAIEPQMMGPALANCAYVLWLAGRTEEAVAAVDELLSDVRLLSHLHLSVGLPLLLFEQRRPERCRVVVEAVIASPWRDAAAAVAAGDLARASEIYASIGSKFCSAWGLLLAAETGQVPASALGEATAHLEKIGAVPFLRRTDALTRASA